MTRITKIILTCGMYQAVWFASIFGAAHNRCYLGVIACAVMCIVHFLWVSTNRRSDTFLCVIAVATGLVTDTVVAWVGAMHFTQCTVYGPVAPPFMLALWIAFALVIRIALGWLDERYILAVVVGAIGGPLAYGAGAHIGAVTVADSLFYAYGIIALQWACVLPFLVYASRVVGRVCNQEYCAKDKERQ